MVRIPRQREHIGTKHEPYELLLAAIALLLIELPK